MKKNLLLVFLFLTLLINGCQKQPSINLDATVEGKVFSDVEQGRANVSLVFDDSWITSNDNTKYNGNLAKAAVLLAADSYYREKDLETNNQNRVLINDNEEEYDYTSIFKALGFTDFEHIDSYKEKEYEYDQNDSVTMNLAYKNVDDKYDTFVVVIRGCYSAGEWNAIYDCGAPSDKYFEITGQHPEWTDKNVVKDVDIAAARANEFIQEFVNKNDTDKPNTMLLVGHSRGANIACVLGSEYEENNYAKMYTYGFNAIKVSLNPKQSKTIFNVYDTNDFFTNTFQFKDEEYKLYGTSIAVDVNNNNEIRKELAELKGVDNYTCASKEFIDSYSKQFKKMFKDRDSLCELKTIVETYDNKIEAQERLDELLLLTDNDHLGLNNGKLLVLSEVEEIDSKYIIKINYYGEVLLRGLGKILAYGEAAEDGLITIFKEDKDACELFTILGDNVSFVGGSHRLINDYVIASKY